MIWEDQDRIIFHICVVTVIIVVRIYHSSRVFLFLFVFLFIFLFLLFFAAVCVLLLFSSKSNRINRCPTFFSTIPWIKIDDILAGSRYSLLTIIFLRYPWRTTFPTLCNKRKSSSFWHSVFVFSDLEKLFFWLLMSGRGIDGADPLRWW